MIVWIKVTYRRLINKGGEEMDKNSGRISIKINGEERNLTEKSTNKSVSSNKVIPLRKDQSSIREEDRTKLPTVYEEKRDSDRGYDNKEIAAAQESEDDFTWVLPDESIQLNTTEIHEIEDVRDKALGSFTYKKKEQKKGIKRKPNYTIKHLLTSIILAIVVGLGFGAIILNLMDMEGEEATSLPTMTTGITEPSSTPDKKAGATPATTSLELSPIDTAVVQEGKYSSEESAKTAIESVKSSGFPATAIESDGAYYVYIGIGVEKGELSTIETKYIEKVNKEPWSKPYTIEGGSYTKVNEKDRDYIPEAQKLFTLLIGQASTAFSTGAISNDNWKSITAQFEKLGKSEGLSESMGSYSASLTSAYNQLKSFQENKDEATLWKSQQSLLDACTIIIIGKLHYHKLH